jgi:hypothetical protein
MGRPYSRDYESELLDKLRENGITDEDLVSVFLNYFSSDETCAALEDACDTYDVEY